MQPLSYHHGDTPLSGQLFMPTGVSRGAVTVFPTIMNHTPVVSAKAHALADAGYVVMMADFYGAPVPDMARAQQLAHALRGDVDFYRARCLAALAATPHHGGPQVAIGFCMGGQAVLELARAGAELDLVASFHGVLTTDRRADQPIKPRILVCHGDADPLVARADVVGLWEELDRVGANWHFHSYGRVKHGFTNPAPPPAANALGYDASADRQSWNALMNLLDELQDAANAGGIPPAPGR